LLLAIELDCSRDRVRGAGTDLSLVIDFWALLAQIDFVRKNPQLCKRRCVKMITIIRKVWRPAKAETAIFLVFVFIVYDLRVESEGVGPRNRRIVIWLWQAAD